VSRPAVPALVLAALVALAGCGGSDDGGTTTSTVKSSSIAPAQASGLLAAVRLNTGTNVTVDLVTLRPDGSRSRVLVKTPHVASQLVRLDAPAWAADGSGVYFGGVTSERAVHAEFRRVDSELFRAGLDGSLTQVTKLRNVLAGVPSPDGKTLLLQRWPHSSRSPLTYSLWLADADGTRPRSLVPQVEGQVDVAGSWSPDGETVAFTRCGSLAPDENGRLPNDCAVYTVRRDGSELSKLADQAREPVFSPDGTRIAFVSDRDGNGVVRKGEDEDAVAMELYAMDADGSTVDRLTETAKLDEGAPSWSPDGSRIDYQAQGASTFAKELRAATADGSCSVTIAGNTGISQPGSSWWVEPVWRPGQLKSPLQPLSCG
jgi:Tol biopolymer transport system component